MQPRLAGLDALRGVAALAVLAYHLQIVFGAVPGFDRAYFAVDFFFMLSGYIMAAIYEPRFAAGLGTGRFIMIRAKRLWFPMAAGATLGFAVLLLKGYPLAIAIPSWAALMAFLPWFGSVRYFLANGPAWSIFFELLANAAHSTVLRRLPVRWLIGASVVSLCALAIMCLGQSLDVGWRRDFFAAGFPRVALSYCLGIALFRSGWVIKAPLPVAALMLVAPMALFPENTLFDLLFVAAFCPVILLIGANAGGGRFASALGNLSFPLYAVHYPVLELVKLAGGDAALGGAAAIALVCLFIARPQCLEAAQHRLPAPRA